jgi:magnesium-transporting ATPase (P-type)
MSFAIPILIIAGLFLTFRKYKINQSHYAQKSKEAERHSTYQKNGKPYYTTAQAKTKVVMRNIVLLGVLALMFCLTEVTLTYFLPFKDTDFDVWLKYFFAKDACYDTMFFLFSLITFWNVNGLAKAISSFLVIITGGSFIDKVIFDENQYLLSDIVLITLAIILSTYIYLKRWKISKHG